MSNREKKEKLLWILSSLLAISALLVFAVLFVLSIAGAEKGRTIVPFFSVVLSGAIAGGVLIGTGAFLSVVRYKRK